MEADGNKLVTLKVDGHDFVSVCVSQNWWSCIVIWLARLSLSCIKNLENSWNLLRVCSYHISLSD